MTLDLEAMAAEMVPDNIVDYMVRDEVRKLKARDRARQIVRSEREGPAKPFDSGTLGQVLARPPQPRDRVEGLIPWEASTLLTAQRKTGKTTAVLNLTRCLVDGDDFLGRFPVRAVDGNIALLNFEVSGAQLARWADDVGIPHDRLYLVNLRGRRNPLSDETDRERLADLLDSMNVETVICDPFGRAYTGVSQNDPGEVTNFLTDLDTFTRAEVGAKDLILTAHAGWNGERTRGSSALEDWADSIITLTRDDGDSDGDDSRYLRAIGRDVDVEEDRLDYDDQYRTLTLAGTGSRKAAKGHRQLTELRATVVDIVGRQPGVNGSEVEAQLRADGVVFQRGEQRKVLAQLVDDGTATVAIGSHGAKRYTLSQPSPGSPQVAHGLGQGDLSLHSPGSPQVAHGLAPQPSPARPYRGGLGGLPGPGENGWATWKGPTCRACGGPMSLLEDGHDTHPGCEPML